MSLYALQEPPRAPQACMSCRKQKRKCSKTLPACALCERMNRHCDYSDTIPPPTFEDFNALRTKIMALESRLSGEPGVFNDQSPYPTPSSTTMATSSLPPGAPAYTPPQDVHWQGIQNRFPAICFLDSEAFKYGGISIPKPSFELPIDILELLGDGSSVNAMIAEYFATVHKWMPIVSQKRMSRNMANPLYEAGLDLALLFLCMKLIISRPQDGIESSQNPIYTSAKRFISLMEATGTASLLVLQANLLVTWYEYGQAIYPAAWLSTGWCVRYGNMLGINGHEEASQLLGRPGTWTEQEERRRTWWAVLLTDRIVSIGSLRYIISSQEPKADEFLPVNDFAWDNGEMSAAVQKTIGSPFTDAVAPYPRLCQASIMMGKVFAHHQETYPSETAKFGYASQLYLDISILARQITGEAASSSTYLVHTAPLALTFSALCTLCEIYSCPTIRTSPEASAMQLQAVDGLKTVSRSIVDFSEQLTACTQSPHELDKTNPIIMDALYNAASTYAWSVRESGDESCQMALDQLRLCLRRLGARWRNAAEYLRILEAQEFTFAMGGASSQ